MKKIISGNLLGGRGGWLLSQTFKFLAIPFSIRFLDGGTVAGPLMGGIFVTYRCNSACGMCAYQSRTAGDELSTREILTIIDEFKRINVSGIGFTGGEPLLRPDIFELISHAVSRHLPVTLNTNGILLNTEEMVRKVIASNPTNINISLDSTKAALHDRLRGRPGLFREATEGLKRLARAKGEERSSISITVITVISEENSAELHEIAALARTLGADRIGFMPLHYYDNYNCRVVASPRLAQISGQIAAIRSIPVENSPAYIKSLDDAFAGKPFPRRCNAGYTSIFVDPYGKVAPCLGYFQMGRWSGDLRRDGDLASFWNSDRYRVLRQELRQCRRCHLNCQAELNYLWPSFLSGQGGPAMYSATGPNREWGSQ